jgi:MFS transporter, ACS family, tartrate transporter
MVNVNAHELERLGNKLIRRLVLPIALLSCVNAIDRMNVSFAAKAMSEDIGLTPTTFGFGVSAFFVAYLLFQYPHAALLRRIGIRFWLLGTVLLWGAATLALSQVTTPREFYAARFLLGVAEAGVAPGFTFYITRWVPSQVRARAMAVALFSIPFSLVIGGPLCGWLLGTTNPLGLAPWRWMFLMQAIPNFLFAFAAFAYFRDRVDESPWLDARERELLVKSVSVPETGATQSARARVAEVLSDWRIFRCALTWLLIMTGSYAMVFWLPQLVRPMGTSEFQIGILSSLPQAALAAGLLINGWHSDRTGERQWHTAAGAAIGGTALMAGALLPPGWAALTLLTMAGAGIGAAQGVFWTIPAALGIGQGRVPVGVIAFISMAGTAGGIIGPTLIGWVRETTGSFVPALVLLATMLIAAMFVIAPLRFIRSRASEAVP